MAVNTPVGDAGGLQGGGEELFAVGGRKAICGRGGVWPMINISLF